MVAIPFRASDRSRALTSCLIRRVAPSYAVRHGARMVSPSLLCAVALLFGFVTAQVLMLPALRLPWPRVERISYGGVRRLVPASGGTIAALSVAGALLPFVLMKLVSVGLSLIALLLCIDRSMRSRMKFYALLTLCLVLEVHCIAVAVALLLFGVVLARQVDDADQVPGIPVALYGPALASGSGLLVIAYHQFNALVGFAMVGALLGIQPQHRFPPRLILGSVGVHFLVAANIMVIALLIGVHDYLTVAMVWSFPLVDTCWRIVAPSDAYPFESARLRGEPEAGLVMATAALSCANAVAMLSVRDNSMPVQMGAVAISLILAVQFRRFLTQGRMHPATRPPWH